MTESPAPCSVRVIGTAYRNVERNGQQVQSVERALAVLRLLAGEGRPLRLSEVQQKTGLPKSIAFRLLKTLEASGFVEQDAETRRFHVGVAAFEVAQAFPRGGSLIRLGRPYLEALVQGSPHTAYLATLDGFEIVYLAAVEGTGPLRVHVSPGERRPAYATAVGKALLAGLSDAEIRTLVREFGLRPLTPATITGVTKLLECIREVRKQGYALNVEEAYPGIGAISAPVRDGAGKTVAGVSLAYATSLFAPDDRSEWVERATAAAGAISATLAGIAVDGGRFAA